MSFPAPFAKIIDRRMQVWAARGLTRETTPATGLFCDLASNDYLGLAGDPRVREAAMTAVERWGTSARASRVVGGTTAIHTELEGRLSELSGCAAGLVFSSGYTANLGVLAALTKPSTQVVMDAHVHASLHDAAALAGARTEFFPHQDLAAADRMLVGSRAPHKILVVEGVYSVLGDAADLVTAHDIALRHEALLIVDESHSLGVLGQGAGAAHAYGIAGSDAVIITASLGKALASQGGVVLCTGPVREYLVNFARTFMFDTGLAPASAAAAHAAAGIVQDEGERLTAELRHNAATICAALRLEPAAAAVQSLVFPGTSEQASLTTEALRARGIGVGCFRPPSVPDGRARLRFTATAGVDRAILASALETVRDVLASVSGHDPAPAQPLDTTSERTA